MGFKPENYSAEEAEDMKKRVSDLDKDSAIYLEGAKDKLKYRGAAHEIAKKEDEVRNELKGSSLPKEKMDKLGDRESTNALEIAEGKIELAESKKELERTQESEVKAIEKSLTDPLTGLGNVDKFKLIAGATLETRGMDLQREKRRHSLVRIDLDSFKEINDTYLHSAGDKVLIKVAETIFGTLRAEERESAYRIGGDEFVVFLPHTNLDEAARAAERIKKAIEELIIRTDDGHKIKITASLGCSSTDQIPTETSKEKYLDALDKNSDAAAYFSKEHGKNRVTTYNEEVMKYKIVSDLWTKSEKNPVVQQLKENKSCQEVIGNIPNIGEAFKEHAMSCGCSDGRIHEHRIGRPGQGILAGVEATVDYIGKRIEERKIKDKFEITSHSGCGAAEMLYEILKKKGEVPSEVSTHDDLGIKFAKDILKSAKERFKNIEFNYRHIKGDEMEKIHNERAIYFDGTEKINIKAVSELPDGFTFTHMPEINRRKTEEELEALCGIALGHHGFGERFIKEKPFWIIISAKDENQLGELRDIAKSVAKKFEGRVEVDGFVVKG